MQGCCARGWVVFQGEEECCSSSSKEVQARLTCGTQSVGELIKQREPEQPGRSMGGPPLKKMAPCSSSPGTVGPNSTPNISTCHMLEVTCPQTLV